jgi:hypothetical protein
MIGDDDCGAKIDGIRLAGKIEVLGENLFPSATLSTTKAT